MGIIDRAKKAISSNVNAILDKAEDPRKLVELTLDEMADHLKRAKADVVSAVAAEKQQRKKCDELRAEVDKWQQRAELAVKAGDDALAREALTQKRRIADQLAEAEQRRDDALANALRMREDLQRMESKHKELSAKKGTIAARAEMAKAGGGAEALGAKGGSNAFEALRDIEAKIEDTEAEAAAMHELNEDAMKEAELESKFRRLERGEGAAAKAPSAVDDELAALKTRVRVK